MHYWESFCFSLSLTFGQCKLSFWIQLRVWTWLCFICSGDNIGKKETVPYLPHALRQVLWVQLEYVSSKGECEGTRRLLPVSPCGEEKKAWDADQQENSGHSQELHGGLRKSSQAPEEPDGGPVNPFSFICCESKAHGWNKPIVPSYSFWDMRLLINQLKIRMSKQGMFA